MTGPRHPEGAGRATCAPNGEGGDGHIREQVAQLASRADHRTLAIWAADCAEHVLAGFEAKHPEDSRPRRAVEAGRAWVRGEISVGEARSAAFASHATAHVAGHAVHTANYAASAAPGERDWQLQRLLELCRSETP